MSVNNVNRVQSTTVQQYEALSPEQLQKRLQIFQNDAVDTNRASVPGASAQISGLAGADPAMTSGTELFNQLMRNATPEQQAAVLEAGNQIAKGLATDGPDSPEFKSALANGLSTVGGALGAGDSNSMITSTVKATIASAENSVAEFATELQNNLDEKAALRDKMEEVRHVIDEVDQIIEDGVYPQTISAFDSEGNPIEVTIHNEDEANALKDKMETLNEDLDGQYSTASDMTQMMQLELQDAIAKENEAVTMLSNIMKANADLIKAIINNLKA